MAPYTFGNEQDRGAYRHEFEADYLNEEASLRWWAVTSVFKSRPLKKPPDINQDIDPVLLPPVIGGTWAAYQKPLTHDKDGNPFTNAAGDLFEGLNRYRSHHTLTITKNFQFIDPALLDDFADAVNLNPFFRLGPRQVASRGAGMEPGVEGIRHALLPGDLQVRIQPRHVRRDRA